MIKKPEEMVDDDITLPETNTADDIFGPQFIFKKKERLDHEINMAKNQINKIKDSMIGVNDEIKELQTNSQSQAVKNLIKIKTSFIDSEEAIIKSLTENIAYNEKEKLKLLNAKTGGRKTRRQRKLKRKRTKQRRSKHKRH